MNPAGGHTPPATRTANQQHRGNRTRNLSQSQSSESCRHCLGQGRCLSALPQSYVSTGTRTAISSATSCARHSGASSKRTINGFSLIFYESKRCCGGAGGGGKGIQGTSVSGEEACSLAGDTPERSRRDDGAGRHHDCREALERSTSNSCLRRLQQRPQRPAISANTHQ